MSAKQAWHSINGLGDFYFFTCPRCKVWTAVPVAVEQIARARPGLSVYCGNGHSTAFSAGESDEDKLRRENDQLTQRLAQKDDEIAWQAAEKDRQRERAEAAERRTSAAKGQITRLKNRAAAGVCPCCNRTFSDLARHMAGKHPGFVKEPTADEQVTVN